MSSRKKGLSTILEEQLLLTIILRRGKRKTTLKHAIYIGNIKKTKDTRASNKRKDLPQDLQ